MLGSKALVALEVDVMFDTTIDPTTTAKFPIPRFSCSSGEEWSPSLDDGSIVEPIELFSDKLVVLIAGYPIVVPALAQYQERCRHDGTGGMDGNGLEVDIKVDAFCLAAG